MTEDLAAAESLHDQAAELLEAFALDALAPEEKAVVTAHLDEGCEDCEDEVSALRSIAARLPLAAPLITVGGAFKRRVMTEVRATADLEHATPGRSSGSPRRPRWLAVLIPPCRRGPAPPHDGREPRR